MNPFRSFLNEGTQAAIVVRTGDDRYSMSFIQYDGISIGKDIKKYFNDEKSAKKLVSKSGDIRGINGSYIEFYTDRKLLITNREEDYIVEEIKNFSNIVYYFDGKKWNFSKSGIKTLADLKPLKV